MTCSFGAPIITDMIITQERKSNEVTFAEIPESTDFWVRIPFVVLTAEKKQYWILVNGENTGYGLMRMPDGYVVGLIITEDKEHFEIIETKVIPKSGTIVISVMGMAIMRIIYASRRSSFTTGWTRIN